MNPDGAVDLALKVWDWYCPSCGRRSITRELTPRARVHECPANVGMPTPSVLQGTRARHVAREREDYIGTDLVRLDANGRPVMAIETQYEDGRSDALVFAPTATAGR